MIDFKIDYDLIKKFTQNLHARWIKEYSQLKDEFLELQENYISAIQDLENHKSILPSSEIYNLMYKNITDFYDPSFEILKLKLLIPISNQLYDPLSGKILIPKDIKKIIKQKKILSYDKVKALLSINVSQLSFEIYSKYLEVKYKSLANKN